MNRMLYHGSGHIIYISGLALQFGEGNPSYVAGKTGCELAREVADIMKFAAVMDEKLRDYYTDTNLKRLRTAMGLSLWDYHRRNWFSGFWRLTNICKNY